METYYQILVKLDFCQHFQPSHDFLQIESENLTIIYGLIMITLIPLKNRYKIFDNVWRLLWKDL